MIESAAPYIVAISALLVCGASALTLIYSVTHFDPPDVRSTAADPREVHSSAVEGRTEVTV